MKKLAKCSHKDFKLNSTLPGETWSTVVLGRQVVLQAGAVPEVD